MTDASLNQLDIPRCDSDSIEEQAAEWCVYLNSGLVTEEGRQQFTLWLNESETHKHTFTDMEQWWRDLDYGAESLTSGHITHNTEEDQHSSVSSFPRRRESSFPSQNLDSRLRGNDKKWGALAPLAIAAALLLAVGIGLFQRYSPDTTIQYNSAVGEIKTVVLSDGTRVTLGGESAILARLTDKYREVELTHGGAYFDIQANSEHPFTVRAADTEIQVIGTQFDVLKGPEDIRISVTEGSVAVTRNQEPGTRNSAASSQQLGSGQQIIASLEGTLSEIHTFDPAQTLAWREGRLEYQDVQLSDVISEVNRYRNQKITLLDPELGEIRVTIAMPIDETDRLLSGLQMSSPVEIERTTFGVTVKKLR